MGDLLSAVNGTSPRHLLYFPINVYTSMRGSKFSPNNIYFMHGGKVIASNAACAGELPSIQHFIPQEKSSQSGPATSTMRDTEAPPRPAFHTPVLSLTSGPVFGGLQVHDIV
jgi:hypothetical protein